MLCLIACLAALHVQMALQRLLGLCLAQVGAVFWMLLLCGRLLEAGALESSRRFDQRARRRMVFQQVGARGRKRPCGHLWEDTPVKRRKRC
ncbi:unnamed protein product [Durusdinium trenchii]